MTEPKPAVKAAVKAAKVVKDALKSKDEPGQKRGPQSRVLSEAEMDEMRPELTAVLMDYSVYLDQAICGTSRTKMPCEIWSMDQEEAAVLADVMLLQARKSVKAAHRVRQLVDSARYVRAAAIVAPRAINTIKYYADNGIGLSLPTARRKRV